jgi:hypothetical protein
MDMHWKEMSDRIVHPRKWSGMAWAVVALVLFCSIGTAVVGVKLVQIADRQAVSFNTK